MKLNIGCGNRKLEGFVNVDYNPAVGPDVVCDVSRGLPFADGSVDEVFMSHSLEHVDPLWPFLDELMRVCADGALLRIVVPHSSAPLAFYPQHATYWSAASWQTMRTDVPNPTGEAYCRLRVRAEKIELHFLCHDIGPCAGGLWKAFRFWEWLWNRSLSVQQFAERLPFGWAEVEYRLRVDKSPGDQE